MVGSNDDDNTSIYLPPPCPGPLAPRTGPPAAAFAMRPTRQRPRGRRREPTQGQRSKRDASAMLFALNAATLQPAQASIQEEDQSAESPNINSDAPGGFVAPRQHGPLRPPIPAARAVAPTQIVGGTSISTSNHNIAQVGRSNGQRGTDSKKRAPRTCKTCTRYGGSNATTCNGRTGRGSCQHFHEDGEPK